MEGFTKVNLDKYESILSKIEVNQTEYEQLQKRCEQLKNNLRVLKILTNPDFAREKLFQVRAKIFSNTYEIFDCFPDSIPIAELREISNNSENVLFYFVEVFISQLFHEKLVTQNWVINVSLVNRTMRISKSLNLKNRVSNPLPFLIPFEEDAQDLKLEAQLLFPDGDYWPNLKFTAIPLDVSYRFNNGTPAKRKNEIVTINQIYNLESFKQYTPKLLQYSFTSNWSREKFMELILKNSYHRLDPNKIFNDCEDGIKAKMSIDGVPVLLELCHVARKFKIEACARDLFLLKKFLVAECGKRFKRDFSEARSSSELKDLKSRLQSEEGNMLNLYHKYVEFMSFYPL